MFVQIHMLQSMPPGNLNRDDTGQPKKCIFGGVTRARISSQCLKRNIRLSQLFQDEFGGTTANRTKYLPRLVGDALLEAGVIPAEEIEGVKAGIAAQFKKESKGDGDEGETQNGEASGTDVTPQLVFFPPPFAKKVASLVTELRKKHPKAYAKLVGRKEKRSKEEDKEADAAIAAFRDAAFGAKESMSVDIGLFGRMTTSDLIADVEAACQVAHAISTHEALTEGDYFTAMDDRQGDFITSQVDGKGAAFLGSGDTVTFYNSAVYYKYFNVDTDALAKHLGPDAERQAHHAAAVLLQAAAMATPTGKQNSFAAHSVPEVILVEVSEKKQPVSYANSFLEAVRGDDLMRESAEALSAYCGSIAAAFAPADTQRFLLAVGNAADVPYSFDADRKASLAELATAVERAVAQRAGVR
jgi:CRISPR system Cascade subunit CasC